MRVQLVINNIALGIWKYKAYYPPVKSRFQLSLNEGGTQLIKVDNICLKREDENPSGSLKDRGLAYQVSTALQQGAKELVISTTGNAGISAASYCQLGKVKLHVFVSPKISSAKLEKLKSLHADVFITPRPISDSLKYAKENMFWHLRSSVSSDAIEGYKSLAFEIDQNYGQISSIFIPVSSGTALVGIAEGFKVLGYLPRFYAVQTTAICPIANNFDKDFKRTDSSLAQALTARAIPREKMIMDIIKESNGGGWVISDEQIIKALEWLKENNIETSAEGGTALAGAMKARTKGIDIGNNPLCLLTGRKY